MTYISVPYTVPESIPTSTERRSHQAQTPPGTYGHPEGATVSLGSLSINDTPTITPSEMSWKSYRNCSNEIKGKYGKLLTDFCRYMEMCDNSGFSAEGIAVGSKCKPYYKNTVKVVNYTTGECDLPKPQPSHNDFGKRKVSGPLLNRWHPKRRAAWIAKMHTISNWYEANRIDGCTLITLTGYQENSGLSFYDTWDNISESRIKLLKILRKYVGKISYFWVVEPHTQNETGYPHFHLAVFANIDNEIKDSNGEGMEDKLRRLYSQEWETGSHTHGLDFKVMKGNDSIKDLKNYLMKYISKGYIGDEIWSPGELIFNAHLYGATHGDRPSKEGEQPDIKGNYTKKYRLIGMSRNLSDLIRPEDPDREDIVWLKVDETEPTEAKDENGDFVKVERIKTLFERQLIPDFVGFIDHETKYFENRDIMRNFHLWLQEEFESFGYYPYDIIGEIEGYWGRQVSTVQSWSSRAYDEKAARRARKQAQDGYL